MNIEVISFDKVNDTYPNYPNFGSIYLKVIKIIVVPLLILLFMIVIFSKKELSCAFCKPYLKTFSYGKYMQRH